MNSTEDRARAAMRAIADTIAEAPPLRLAPATEPARDGAGGSAAPAGEQVPVTEPATSRDATAPAGRGRRAPGRRGHAGYPRAGRPPRRRPEGRRLWSVLAPLAAAAVIAVVALTLSLVRGGPDSVVAARETAGSASASSPSTVPAGPGSAASDPVPAYYVAWMQARDPFLVVGDTQTGKHLATIGGLPGVRLLGVYGGAADDKTFLVAAQRAAAHGVAGGTAWYLLRISPGNAREAEFSALPVPLVSGQLAGAALSPDGTRLAIATANPTTLRVYSVAGAAEGSWQAAAPGKISAATGQAAGWPSTAMTLRWSPDGRQVGFTWNGTSIRVISAAAPAGDLVASSALLVPIGTSSAATPGAVCYATRGWQLTSDGVLCAGNELNVFSSCATKVNGTCREGLENFIGWLAPAVNGKASSETRFFTGASARPPGSGSADAYIGWASADGSVVLGSVVKGGQSRFGVFHAATFSALPALPASLPGPAGVLPGAVAW